MSYFERIDRMSNRERLEYQRRLSSQFMGSEVGQWVDSILSDIREEAVAGLIRGEENGSMYRGIVAAVDTLVQRFRMHESQLEQLERIEKEQEEMEESIQSRPFNLDPGVV